MRTLGYTDVRLAPSLKKSSRKVSFLGTQVGIRLFIYIPLGFGSRTQFDG